MFVSSGSRAQRSARFARLDIPQNRPAAEQSVARLNISASAKGHIYGLTLSNDAGDLTNDIGVAVGEAASDETNPQLMVLGSALIKQLDSNWAAGTNQGMRNSAAAITNTTYHIYLVSKANGANADIYAHTSTTVATVLTALQIESGGASYIHARRIGSIVRASAVIVGFVQTGDEVVLKVPSQTALTNQGTSAVTVTLGSIPSGLKVMVGVGFFVDWSTSGASDSILISSPDMTDAAPNAGASPGVTIYTVGAATPTFATTRLLTGTSSNLRARADVWSTSDTLRVWAYNYTDLRGRLG